MMTEVLEFVREASNMVAFSEIMVFQAVLCLTVLLVSLCATSSTWRAVALSIMWTVYAHVLVCIYWGRYCLLGFTSGPIAWIHAQVALVQLLTLHARHKHDELKAWW